MAQLKRDKPSPPGVPGWMVTYGDMMSLLLCFFVMLVSMSTTEIEKFKAAAASLKGALSVLPFQERPMPQPITPRDGGAQGQQRKKNRAVARLKQIVRERKLASLIRVSDTPGGIHITIGDPALFDTARANLKPEIYSVLEAIVDVIQTGTNAQSIRVEGHTDNIPISNAQFDDNWELSIARALSVIRFFRTRGSFDPRQLRPVGCGEFHPVVPNTTPEGRARNRRVEMYIEIAP